MLLCYRFLSQRPGGGRRHWKEKSELGACEMAHCVKALASLQSESGPWTQKHEHSSMVDGPAGPKEAARSPWHTPKA